MIPEKYIISYKNQTKINWDIFILLLAFQNSLLIPVEMAFDPPFTKDATFIFFNNIIDFMNRGVPTDGSVLRMRIHDLDRKREQDLAVVEPEFAALINYTYGST